MALLRRAADITPYFLIQASGGKDSNVAFPLLADLRRENSAVRVAACHWYMVPPEELTGKPGIQCVERPVRILCAQLEAPLFFAPRFNLMDVLYLGAGRRPTRDTRGCSECGAKGRDEEGEVCERCGGSGQGAFVIKPVECEDAGRLSWAAQLAGLKRADLLEKGEDGRRLHPLDSLPVHPWTGIWSVLGQRSNDSLSRRAMISSFRLQQTDAGVATGGSVGFNPKQRRVFPVHDWTAQEVLAFARARKIPPAAQFGGINGSDLDPAEPASVETLKRLYPRDYERFMEMFPSALATSELKPTY